MQAAFCSFNKTLEKKLIPLYCIFLKRANQSRINKPHIHTVLLPYSFHFFNFPNYSTVSEGGGVSPFKLSSFTRMIFYFISCKKVCESEHICILDDVLSFKICI